MPFKQIQGPLLVLGLLLIAIGLPVSKAAMSIGQIVLGLSWFLGGNYLIRIRTFFRDPVCISVIGIYLLLILGLLHTQNWKDAMDVVRIQAPLFIIPFVVASSDKISKSAFKLILFAFILFVWISTVISLLTLLGLTHKEVNDIRDVSFFISHIRFALMICLSITILVLTLNSSEFLYSTWAKIALWTLVLWFVAFLILIESVTGIGILLVLALLLFLRSVFSVKNKFLKFGLLTSLILVCLALITMLGTEVRSVFENKAIPISSLELRSPSGNLYDHRPEVIDSENGNPLWIYISRIELKNEWEKRSALPFDGKDERGQFTEYTLMRFLTSKGLRKDSTGVNALSENEIRSIEKGIANVNHQNLTNLSQRIQQILWEVKNFSLGGNPSGHSVAQRFEFWRTSLLIIQDHPFFGVGTGDVNHAFAKKYDEIKSPLTQEKRLKSHNQYLLVAVSSGCIGLLFFLFFLTYPFLKLRKNLPLIYPLFLILFLLSICTEDTLTTQAGATFFAFFNTLFLFSSYQKK